MKLYIKIILGLILTICTYQYSLFAQTELAIPLSEPGKDGSLEIKLTYGSIKVYGYDGKEVLVVAETEKDKNEGRSEKLANATGEYVCAI